MGGGSALSRSLADGNGRNRDSGGTGRGNKGAGSRLARHDGSQDLSNGRNRLDGGSGSRGIDSSLVGRTDGDGGLNNGRNNDLGLGSRAVGHGDVAAGDGVHLGRGESAGDLARGSDGGDSTGGGSGGQSRDDRGLDSSTVRKADLELDSSSKLDSDLRGERDVENVENLNIDVDSKAKSEEELRIDGDNAVVGLDENKGIGQEVNPESNLSTSLNDIKIEELNTGLNGDVRTEAETELDCDGGRQINLSTDTDVESLSLETLKLAADDLLVDDRNVNVVSLGERDVETGRQIDTSINGHYQIESESSAKLDLKNLEIDLELRGSEQLDGLEDTSGGREINLNPGLDAGEVEADGLVLLEVVEALKANLTLDLGGSDVEVKLDVKLSLSVESNDALEEGLILPALGEVASGGSLLAEGGSGSADKRRNGRNAREEHCNRANQQICKEWLE